MDESQRTRRTRLAVYTLVLIAITVPMLACPSSALAWGNEGHQIVALIAAHELSPSAAKAVQDLLGGADMPSAMVAASTWPDEIRPSRPQTAPWHYVNIEIGTAGYDAARDCPRDDCVVAQIEREEHIIADRTLLPAVRAEALRFLIHFVGDIHQPLHASDDHDRGGNEIHIIYNGTTMNMHSLWDRDMIERLGDDAPTIASKLESGAEAEARIKLKSGTPADWANESFRLAKTEIYAQFHANNGEGAPIVIPVLYVNGERSAVSEQLLAAGLRLGWLLNKTWPSAVPRVRTLHQSNRSIP